MGDKPSSFVGSREWIGSQEVSYVMSSLLDVDGKFIILDRGGLLEARATAAKPLPPPRNPRDDRWRSAGVHVSGSPMERGDEGVQAPHSGRE